MTPPEKPSMPSSSFRLTRRVVNTAAAPKAVKNQVNRPASNACTTGCKSVNHLPMADSLSWRIGSVIDGASHNSAPVRAATHNDRTADHSSAIFHDVQTSAGIIR